MWIVLLDRSGSMDGGFHGSATGFRGRASTTTAEQKLEAAKQVLQERLAGADRTTVAIFAFDHATELIYDGPSDEAARIDSALARIVPGGGTNVAAALDAARDHAVHTGLHSRLSSWSSAMGSMTPSAPELQPRN